MNKVAQKRGQELMDTRQPERLETMSGPDAKYVQLIDSYRSTRVELEKTAKSLWNARHLHDREEVDRFRQDVRKLRNEYETLKDQMGLNGPAELTVRYDDSGIKKIDGTTRDWTVANYHLTRKIVKNREVLIEGEQPQILDKSETQWAQLTSEDGGGKYRKAGSMQSAIFLTPDGVFTHRSPLYEYETPNAAKYWESRGECPVKTGEGRTLYVDQSEMKKERASGKTSIRLVEELIESPAYKNKIRITAKRIEG